MPSIPAPSFYVYILCRPDNSPFYVGKGTGDRLHRHEADARRGHRCHKCNVIRKIWRSGGAVQKYIVFTTDDEAEALAYEVELIALYRQDTLANLTSGGEGASNPSPTYRAKLRRSRRAYLRRPGVIEKISRTASRMWSDPARRTRQAEAQRNRWTPEARQERSEQSKAVWEANHDRMQAAVKQGVNKPESLARKSAASKAMATTGEARARTGQYSKARWDDPEARQRQLDAIRAAITPERQAKKATAIKASWTDPEVRAKRIAGLKAAAANPELRAKKREAAKAWWAERKAGKDKTP